MFDVKGAVSLSPLSPSATPDSVHLCLPSEQLPQTTDSRFHQRRHSTPNRMTHIRESPSSEDVEDYAWLPEVVQAAAADIPPDSPIRSMFVILRHIVAIT